MDVILDSGRRRLKRFRAAIEAYNAGLRTRPPTALFIGDSTTMGAGTNGTLTTGDIHATSFPSKLGPILTARGLPARQSSFVGCNRQANTVASNDARWSWGAGWGPLLNTMGGMFLRNNTTTNALSFTPAQVFDSLEIYVGTANFNWNVDGGTNTTTTAAPSNAPFRRSYTVARGVHTINIMRNSGDNYVQGIHTWDATAKEISILPAGIYGSVIGTHGSSSAWSAALSIPQWAPDLVVVSLVINDTAGGTTLASYESSYRVLIEAALNAGADVLLLTSPPWTLSNFSLSENYRHTLRGLAARYLIPFGEILDVWPVRSAEYFYDDLHQNELGSTRFANAVADCIFKFL